MTIIIHVSFFVLKYSVRLEFFIRHLRGLELPAYWEPNSSNILGNFETRETEETHMAKNFYEMKLGKSPYFDKKLKYLKIAPDVFVYIMKERAKFNLNRKIERYFKIGGTEIL